VDDNASGDAPAPWPPANFSYEELDAVMPVEYWEELSEAEITRRTTALVDGTDREGHSPVSVIGWRKQSLLRAVRAVLDAPAKNAKWMELSPAEAEQAVRLWANPPASAGYFSVSRNDEELAAPVKAAINGKNQIAIRQWLECLMQLAEQSPGDGSARRFRFLDLLARFALAGHSLPDFEQRAGKLMTNIPRSSDTDFGLSRARIFLAIHDSNSLKRLVFEEPVNKVFQFSALREFAWQLPDKFFLDCRSRFAFRTGSAHWMAAVAAVRGTHPNSATLVNEARNLNTDVF
jgi:hypothetical protein